MTRPLERTDLSCPSCNSSFIQQEDDVLECYSCGFVWEDESFVFTYELPEYELLEEDNYE